MKKITINLTDDNYDIYIGDCLSNLNKFIKLSDNLLIITDENVKRLYLDKLVKKINNYQVFIMGNKPENNKNLLTYEACVKFALDNYFDRHLTVLAFGGGAVTDFAGFFASTYKRGVKLINIPTTLLAHDSAVGGKTALNVGTLKNVIGTFYQPQAVLYHLPLLRTLPYNEVLSGFGEIIKHDLLADGYLLNEVFSAYNSLDKLLFDDEVLEEIIYRAILVKKLYVEMDVYDELGRRQYLNLGHTLGHALEITTGLTHGEAISFGICFALFLSDNHYYKTLSQTLIKWGYFRNIVLNNGEILARIKNDKKNHTDKLVFIGLKSFGNPEVIYLSVTEFKERLKAFQEYFYEITR